MEREEILVLSYLGIGIKRYSLLKEKYKSLLEIPKSEIQEVSKLLKIDEEKLSEITKEENLTKTLERLKNVLDKYQVKFVTVEDKDYPNKIKDLSDKPLVLFYKGNILLANNYLTCGIVGTRRNDNKGKNHTKNIVDLLVDNDVCIVSGLARGIDIIAHRRALERNGKTIAVIGHGLDYVYPPEHKKEFEEIEEKGLILTEFFIGENPLKRNFFIRNRIISGLSNVVVIVQAPEGSGALITGEYALKQKRTLFAIPGDIENPLHRGCNLMIRKGAKILIDYKDILEELGYKATQSTEKVQSVELNEEEKFVYSLITGDMTLDDLAEISGLPVNKLYPILLSLEIKGIIIQNAGGTFSRIII